VLILGGLASASLAAGLDLTPEQREFLKSAQLDKTFNCETTGVGLQGCWDLPGCQEIGTTSFRDIVEFRADGIFLKHRIGYSSRGCDGASVSFVRNQTPHEGRASTYKARTKSVQGGGQKVTYDVIFFSDQAYPSTGDLVAFKGRGHRLCFFPSQLTATGFTTQDNNLSKKWPYESDYFFSGDFLDDMTACLKRAS